MTRRLFALVATLGAAVALAQYQPADQGQRPQGGGLKVLPESFLRGYDPVTVYFSSDVVGPEATGDDGEKYLKLTPGWPGAYTWVDRRTLHFRPAEPWPALARFQVDAQGTRKVLTTMMSPPQAMAPSPGSEGLRPFRVVTLTFPQALPAASLKKMISNRPPKEEDVKAYEAALKALDRQSAATAEMMSADKWTDADRAKMGDIIAKIVGS